MHFEELCASYLEKASATDTRTHSPVAEAFALLRRDGMLPANGAQLAITSGNEEALDVQEVVALEAQCAAAGTSLRELMERAGSAVAHLAAGIVAMQRAVAEDESPAQPVVILAGSGNNGGDGWVAARKLAEAGIDTVLVASRAPEDIKAEPAHSAAMELGASARVLIAPDMRELEALMNKASVVVDALLGTGFTAREVKEPSATWIRLANAARAAQVPVVAVDCPSGLDAQTGQAAASCITADATVTMLRVKRGLIHSQTKPYTGLLLLAPLGV